MKKLKFSDKLIKLVLSGEKTSTWRINDDKDISVGDVISLCDNNGKEFTRANVFKSCEKVFDSLTDKDKEGHEKFGSDEEMYKVYSEYYKIDVDKNTKVKIIRFKIV